MTLLMLRGLPASGKTTFARQLGQGWARINRDDLRAMMFPGQPWSGGKGLVVESIAYQAAEEALSFGFSVVWDNTSLNDRHQRDLRVLAKRTDADFKVEDFEVPIDECIRRDAARSPDQMVGEDVIRGMAERYGIE